MIYVIKAAITLALLYSCFFVFLSKETFHRFNRCMLVGIMLVSLVMPMFHFTTSHPTTLNEEVYIVQNYIENDTTPIIVSPKVQRITWIQVLTWIYLTGVAVMLILTIVQAIALTRFLRCGVRHTDSRGNTVILHNGEVPPFSIFRYIVMSVKDYETSRQYILTHEQEHIRLAHTYDLLLLQGMKILQWFNPFIWFLSRDLKAVHEYEADQAVINQGIDAKSYQQLLVMKVVGNRLQPFTNNLNHGSLKKRIIMMYQKPSNRWLMLKALCAIPVAALTINTFATPIETDPVEDMVKTLETTSVPTINEVKENVLTTVESVDETTFAIHPVADQYGRITGFTHEGKPADGYFECTAEYVFINGRQATEAELRNYKTLLANSTFEMVKTENGTAKYNYKDKHGIIVIHTQEASAAPDDNDPLVIVNGVEVGNLAILIIQCPMEIVKISDTDTRINNCGIVGRIHRQVEPHDAIAAMNAMVSIRLLAGMVVCSTVKRVTLAVADVFVDGGFVINRPIAQMQINGLVATILGLGVMFVKGRGADHLAIEIVSVSFANGIIFMRHFVGMHHDGDTHILRTAPTVVGDMAGIGRSTHRWSCHRILNTGVIQTIGRCPAIGVVTRTASRQGVQRGRLPFAEFGIIGCS